MIINNSAGARAEFYDRSATTEILRYGETAVAPHGLTLRGSYTVPADRKAILNGFSIFVVRRQAGVALGRTTGYFKFVPSGGGSGTVFSVTMFDAAVGANSHEALAPGFVMYPADELELYTADGSGAGSCDYDLVAMMTEFSY